MASEIKVDTISEKTSANGIAIDSVTLKDGTVTASGDTAAGDNASVGYTSAEGLILTGQGSTSDVTLKNDADGTVFTVPTGTDDILFPDSAKGMWGASSDMTLYHDGSNSFITNAVGALKVATETSGIAITLGHSTSEVTVADNLTVTGTITLADGSINLADLDIDGGTEIGAAIVDADLFIADDGAGGANRKVLASRIKTYAGGASVMNELTDVSMDITNFTDGLLIQPDSDGSAPSTGTLSSATDNIGIGKDVFGALTSGDENVVFGNTAGDALTSGYDNVLIGYGAGSGLTTEYACVVIGHNAMPIGTGYGNVCVGRKAGELLTDALNSTLVGDGSGKRITTGSQNTCLGINCANAITTGAGNVAVGHDAGHTLTTGSNNISIGKEAKTAASDTANSICIGNALTAASNDFSFGKASNVVTNDFDADADWARSSDERLKTNIQTIDYNGLDFINELRPVTFNWKSSQDVPIDMPEYRKFENLMNTDIDIDGMIAQEVKVAMDNNNITTSSFRGWKLQESGTQSLSKASFVLPLIKAVQELSTKVDTLEAKVAVLEG